MSMRTKEEEYRRAMTLEIAKRKENKQTEETASNHSNAQKETTKPIFQFGKMPENKNVANTSPLKFGEIYIPKNIDSLGLEKEKKDFIVSIGNLQQQDRKLKAIENIYSKIMDEYEKAPTGRLAFLAERTQKKGQEAIEKYNSFIQEYDTAQKKYNQKEIQKRLGDINDEQRRRNRILTNGYDYVAEKEKESNYNKQKRNISDQKLVLETKLNSGFLTPEEYTEKYMELDTQEKRIDAYLESIQKDRKIATENAFEIYSKNTDFDESSKPNPKYMGGNGYDRKYTFINKYKNSDAYETSFMTDEERSVYNYLYHTRGKEEAEEYLFLIQEALNQRYAKKAAEDLDRPIDRLFYGLGAGINSKVIGAKQLFSERLLPTSREQYTDQEAMKNKNISSLERFAHDLLYTIGNQLPSIATADLVGGTLGLLGAGAKTISRASKIAGLSTMGIGVYGNAYNSALRDGATKGAATNYAFLVTGSELGLQSLIGGFSKLGGGKLTKGITNKINAIDNSFWRFSAKLGKNMFDEGLEEGIQELLEPIFQVATYSDTYDGAALSDFAYSFLLGAASAGIMEAGNTMSEVRGENKAISELGANVRKLDTPTIDFFIKHGMAAEKGSTAYRAAQKIRNKQLLGEEVTDYELGRMYGESTMLLLRNRKQSQKNARPFRKQIEDWGKSGKNRDTFFDLGKPSVPMLKAGVGGNRIQLDASKVLKIMKDHPEMTMGVIKQLDKVVENPVLILRSKNKDAGNSFVLYGEVAGENGIPVMVAVRTNLRGGVSGIEDVVKITSAYTRRNTQNLINTSEILYVDPNKKRIADWSYSFGLQLPSATTASKDIGDSLDNSVPQGTPVVKDNFMSNNEKYAENQKNYPTIVREQGMLPTDQDVIKENRARRAKTVTARTGILADVSDADIQQAEELGAVLGKDIIFYREPGKNKTVIDGYYDGESIYINAESNKPIPQIIAHELTHSIQNTESYKKLMKAVRKYYGKNFSQTVQERIRIYKKRGIVLTEPKAAFEVVATFVEEHLLTNEAAIRAIVKNDYSLGQHIVHFANNLLAKLGNKNAEARILLQNMRKIYTAALKESRMKDLQGEQRNDIMTGEGGRGYGIDESGTVLENDRRYDEGQTRAYTGPGERTVDTSIPRGRGNRRGDEKSTGTGIIRSIEEIVGTPAFRRLRKSVRCELPEKVNKELYKKHYLDDPRMDIYEFSELVA